MEKTVEQRNVRQELSVLLPLIAQNLVKNKDITLKMKADGVHVYSTDLKKLN